MGLPYNAATLSSLAEEIDTRAKWLIAGYVVAAGLVCGAVVQAIASRAIFSPNAAVTFAPFFMGFAIGGLIGAMMGQSKAFELKLRSQLIACLVSIEANTRI